MCDVFLIDDESDIRIALAQSVELADLNAQFFASVEEALLAIKAQGLPLVIVSDICLPGLSGQNLLSSVLNQDSELPVILSLAMAIFRWRSKPCMMVLTILLKSPSRLRG
ncbi:C4-dicarboxylate transport transcriptional regulatory protein [Vibrio cholerae]|nr:C4-dicarboxylate transport transcriptional regulatory protein [Vibrio cholerae]